MKYIKKPVVVDAVLARDVITRFRDCKPASELWVRDAIESGRLVVHTQYLSIHTLEGVMVGEPDDWLIRGTKGELYPCKPDVFADVYELWTRDV